MSTHAAVNSRFPHPTDLVSSDFLSLASHMKDCARSRGRFFAIRSAFESAHAMTAPRIVTTGAVFLLVGLGLLAFA